VDTFPVMNIELARVAQAERISGAGTSGSARHGRRGWDGWRRARARRRRDPGPAAA
jgi:hypothetical protein